MPQKDEISEVVENKFYSAAFEKFLSQGKLMGSRCRKCQALFLPPRPNCPKCHSRNMDIVSLKGRGRLVAYTVIAVASKVMAEQGFDREHPYACGVVELEEGIKLTARLLGVDVTHPESIKIGTPFTIEFPQVVGGKRTFLAFRTASE